MGSLGRFFRDRKATQPAPDASATEADRLIAEGNRLEDEGDSKSALTVYQEALLAKPGYPRARLNIANALRQLGRAEQSASILRELLHSSPDYVSARFNLGALLAASGDVAG